MKITVGHLMIVAGVGTYVVLGPLGGFARLDKAMGKGAAAPTDEKPLTATLPPPSEPAAEPPADAGVSSNSGESVSEKLPAGETAPAETKEEAPAPVPPPAAAEPAAPAAPAVKAPRPHRRRRRAKPIVSSTEGSAPAATASNLVGQYVSLKLANGREVKGALVEQSASFYKIELPGLGAMSYPVRDVVSIAPAQ